jgi:hypothetical protein
VRGDPRRVAQARPPPRTKWTRRVPHPVLIGHAASLTRQFRVCVLGPGAASLFSRGCGAGRGRRRRGSGRRRDAAPPPQRQTPRGPARRSRPLRGAPPRTCAARAVRLHLLLRRRRGRATPLSSGRAGGGTRHASRWRRCRPRPRACPAPRAQGPAQHRTCRRIAVGA